MLHAEWERIAPTDLVFPFVLFIVGASLVVALRPYLPAFPVATAPRPASLELHLQILRRAFVLVVLGLSSNAFPALLAGYATVPRFVAALGVAPGHSRLARSMT